MIHTNQPLGYAHQDDPALATTQEHLEHMSREQRGQPTSASDKGIPQETNHQELIPPNHSIPRVRPPPGKAIVSISSCIPSVDASPPVPAQRKIAQTAFPSRTCPPLGASRNVDHKRSTETSSSHSSSISFLMALRRMRNIKQQR
jgi:hypothetical protein